MKSKKFVTILCACAMLLSSTTATASEPMSNVAGQTISVQVVEDTGAGLVSRVIQVPIPRGATKAEENAIVHSAALGQDMISPLSAYTEDYLFSKRDFFIHQDPMQIGSSNKGNSGYDKVIIDTTFSTYMGGSHTVYFQVRDVHLPDNATAWHSTTATAGINRVVTIGTISLVTDPSKGISVYAKADPGNTVGVSLCMVSAVISSS